MLRLNNSYTLRKTTNSILRKIKRNYANDTLNVPKQADVVIIGGGVIGTNTLYHLSKRGISAVLLERNKLTSGTTWHTGGLVWSLRHTDVDTALLQKTRNLLNSLELETGVNPGWTNNGGIFIARTKERLEEYKNMHTMGHYFHVNSQMISPAEAQQLAPILDPKAFYGAMYSPQDGYADPSMYVAALAKGATTNGGKIIENCPVTHILTETSDIKKIKGVETPHGTIKTSCVVNCAGAWAREICQMVGVDIPLVPFKHAYVITGSVPHAKGSPCIRDHDGSLYFRPQGDSILFGGYETNPEILKEMPDDFHFRLFDLDKTIFDRHWKNACELCPSFVKAGIKSDICGPESFTPDHKAIMGEDPKVIGLFHGCGFNSLGIQLSGGAGEQLAAWVADGRPDLPMHNYDIRRFTPAQRLDRAWITETTHESFVQTYSIVYIHDQPLAGRNHKIDPFHEALVAGGAVMEQAQGWERPGYFVKDRTAPVRGYDWYGTHDHVDNPDKRYENELAEDYTYGFSKHQEVIKEEALAARNNVALFDTSCYTKMYLTGSDAQKSADWLFTANLDKGVGSVVYTCSLNSKGGVEADVTVTNLEEGVGTLVGPILKGKGYYIVAGGAAGYQALAHFKREIARKSFKAHITAITDRLGILSIQGPKSRELLQSITETPITDENFPPGMSHLIKINNHVCRAMRISYVGELGYELHIPFASCVPVYNKVMEGGRGFELRHAGFRALLSLSCEKGYHLLNHDLRLNDNPVEANLAFLCRKDGHYLGKQHVERLKQEGIKKRRVFLTLQDNVALFGYETIWRDDHIVGFLRRGEYAFSLDTSIGVGYIEHPKGKVIDEEFLKKGNYQIEARNKKYPATLFLKSPFDPKNQRLYGKYDHQFEEQAHFED